MTSKYKLVPADVLDQTLAPKTRRLINLDNEMKRILGDSSLDSEQKYIKYMMVFLEYLKMKESHTAAKQVKRRVTLEVEQPEKRQAVEENLGAFSPPPTSSPLVVQRKNTRLKLQRKPALNVKRSPYALRKKTQKTFAYDYFKIKSDR